MSAVVVGVSHGTRCSGLEDEGMGLMNVDALSHVQKCSIERDSVVCSTKMLYRTVPFGNIYQ